ncbi:galactosyltransferase family protein [Hibiscus syriacus]|uniref:RING-type E3 ubiquitin transferase n=1 Tax=Hibiscus syriacus TaxID=106335 RepID=A0A6A2WWB8_HIBSY|nr:E3 ubiquitin-protein ligase MPSR1-like [Hibiscus syriacus]KAE8666053.1 galactosyltransferase family protein [Hibiscus syriacus]
MVSETEASQVFSLFERLLRLRELYLSLPFILRSSDNDNDNNDDVSRQNTENPDQETAPQRERTILVNPFIQGMVVIEGASNLEALVRGWANKDGHPPASKASIEAMPSVDVGEDEDGECVVCLEEWKAEELAKEMPCKHKFHGECIEKWLEIHGSCPVCRYKMSVDDEEKGKKTGEQREIWVRFSFNNGPPTGSGNANETQN